MADTPPEPSARDVESPVQRGPSGESTPESKLFAVVSAVLLGAGGLGLGFALAVVVVGALQVAGYAVPPSLLLVISLVTVQFVGCVVVSLAYLGVRPRLSAALDLGPEWRPAGPRLDVDASVPSIVDLAVVVGGYVVALGGALTAAAVVQAVLQRLLDEEEPATNAAAEIGLEQPELLLLLVPASILLIGPAEELLFRGVVQGRLREAFGPVAAIVGAAVVFAGLHFFALVGGSPAGNVARLTILLVPAVVMGAAYEYTDNIAVPALIHGLYNATLFGLLYVAITYADAFEAGQQAALALV